MAGSRLLAQAHKRRAHQPLQLRVLLNAQAQTQVPQRFAKQLWIGFAIQFGHLGESGRGFLARFRLFAVRASRIILKDANGIGDVAVLDQLAYVGLHVARRNAPRLLGKQHGALAALRHCRPQLRFRQDSRVGHLIFVRAENLP